MKLLKNSNFLWQLDTFGNKFWNTLPYEIKLNFFIMYERWKNPQITHRNAKDKSKSSCMFAFTEFNSSEQFQIRMFCKKLNMMK